MRSQYIAQFGEKIKKYMRKVPIHHEKLPTTTTTTTTTTTNTTTLPTF
jgi:hypothetical protein